MNARIFKNLPLTKFEFWKFLKSTFFVCFCFKMHTKRTCLQWKKKPSIFNLVNKISFMFVKFDEIIIFVIKISQLDMEFPPFVSYFKFNPIIAHNFFKFYNYQMWVEFAHCKNVLNDRCCRTVSRKGMQGRREPRKMVSKPLESQMSI